MENQDVSYGGFRVVASFGPPKKALPQHTKRIEITARGGWFKRSYACGHRSDRWFQMHVFGAETTKIRQKELCPCCYLEYLKKHTIHCALCGLPIHAGDPVALYDDSYYMLTCATEAREGVVVGCLRFDCCPSAGFLAGYWSEEGYVPYAFGEEQTDEG